MEIKNPKSPQEIKAEIGDSLLNKLANYYEANYPSFNFLIGQFLKEIKKRDIKGRVDVKEIRRMLARQIYLEINEEKPS